VRQTRAGRKLREPHGYFPSLANAGRRGHLGQLLEEGCAIMADQVTEETPAPTSTATTRQTEPAVIAGISSGEGEMVWSFEIVPVGGHQRLAAGNFNAPDLEAAQQHAQTVNELHVSASAELDVRLLDGAGNEVWRGTYLGSHG
jgi:hypothetical protein